MYKFSLTDRKNLINSLPQSIVYVLFTRLQIVNKTIWFYGKYLMKIE